MARTTLGAPSRMNEYEVQDHSHRQAFGEMDWTPSVFSGLVTPIHEEICSRQPFCLSYTLAIDQMWLFVPLQQVIGAFVATIPEYPFQMGSSLSASNINYDLFRRADAMKRLEQMQKELTGLRSGSK